MSSEAIIHGSGQIDPGYPGADLKKALITMFGGGPSDDLAFPADEAGNATIMPSFESVLQLYHKRVYNLAYRLLGNPDEAADLTQETFVRAYKAYRRFRGSSDGIYPWLCQITVNGCKNKFKELGRRGRHEAFSLDDPLDTGESSLSLEIGDDTSNPAGIFERQEFEAKIQEAIQALPPEYRIVVILRDMQGLSYKEIADATGLSMDNVKARLFRARVTLRRRLSPYIEE